MGDDVTVSDLTSAMTGETLLIYTCLRLIRVAGEASRSLNRPRWLESELTAANKVLSQFPESMATFPDLGAD